MQSTVKQQNHKNSSFSEFYSFTNFPEFKIWVSPHHGLQCHYFHYISPFPLIKHILCFQSNLLYLFSILLKQVIFGKPFHLFSFNSEVQCLFHSKISTASLHLPLPASSYSFAANQLVPKMSKLLSISSSSSVLFFCCKRARLLGPDPKTEARIRTDRPIFVPIFTLMPTLPNIATPRNKIEHDKGVIHPPTYLHSFWHSWYYALTNSKLLATRNFKKMPVFVTFAFWAWNFYQTSARLTTMPLHFPYHSSCRPFQDLSTPFPQRPAFSLPHSTTDLIQPHS